MSKKNLRPPILSETKSYDDWLKLVKIWSRSTDIEKSKQGSVLLLSLDSDSLDLALQIPEDDLFKDDGVKTLIDKLNELYKDDDALAKYETLEQFDNYRRTSDTSMVQYIIEFEKRLNKTKELGVKWDEADDILAFRLLKNSNLSESKEQLAKATIGRLTYKNVKDKLRAIFNKNVNPPPTGDQIKTEQINFAGASSWQEDQSEYDHHYQQPYEEYETFFNYKPRYPQSPRQHQFNQYPNQYPTAAQSQHSTSFRRNNHLPTRRFSYPPPRGAPAYRFSRNLTQQPRCSTNFQPSFSSAQTARMKPMGRNPPDRNGQPTRCNVCDSVNHWTPQCPDAQQPTLFQETEEVTLFESDLDDTNQLTTLVAETQCAAVIDCGATKTCCGQIWWQGFTDTLSEEDLKNITISPSNKVFKFGSGGSYPSLSSAEFPANINGKQVTIRTDIVEANVPLLLSRESLKNAEMKIDFKNDKAELFGSPIELINTRSGHYAIPITTAYNQFNLAAKKNNYADSQLISTATTFLNQTMSPNAIALKLHKQFAHPPMERLIKFVNSAGQPWCSETLKEEIRKVSQNCETCRVYKKPPPRPVVGLPLASKFQECVAMDLKFYNKHILLHLIDHATRLSASSVLASKKTEKIIESILQNWIAVYGTAEKFLSDNGGEFCNPEFINLCEGFNITVKTTAAESPWSNGLVERHNQIIASMLDKVIEDTGCSIHIALAWSVNAKNSLDNIHGFSPYQLSIGTNPRLPTSFTDKPPALDFEPATKMIKQNLNALHKAREAFITSENSERIRRALRHNIRTTNNYVYTTGDSVYYKRANSKRWRGPGRVLGRDGQQVLVKHGSTYIRVHTCRLMPTREKDQQQSNPADRPEKVETNIHEGSSSNESETEDNADNFSPPNITPTNDHDTTEPTIVNESQQIVNDQQHADSLISNMDQIQKGTMVRYQLKGSNNWKTGQILNRAGKATGKYKNAWNIQTNDQVDNIDFDRNVEQHEIISKEQDVEQHGTLSTNYVSDDIEPNLTEITNPQPWQSTTDEIQQDISFLSELNDETLLAKQRELSSWKDEHVFDEIDDNGQNTISTRWVLKPKIIDGKHSVKARLCARGFEEDKHFRTDSPTCSREGVRVALVVIACHKWELKSLDFKSAFLQGKPLEREVYLKPPKEAKTNKIWLLRKCVYGLADASRFWYLRVREEILKLNGEISALDQGLFIFFRNGKPYGIISCFVDDMIYGGDAEFEENVILKLKATFKISTEGHQAFEFLGINVFQNTDKSISIHQTNYINSINPMYLQKGNDLDRSLTPEEKSQFRSTVGQLNWVSGISRPDIAFDVCIASAKSQNPTLRDALALNKTVKYLKNNPCQIVFPSMDPETVNITLFADASFNNLPNGGSQGGQINFLSDNNNNCCPIAWNSSRIKRVVRSTIAAEIHSLADGFGTTSYFQHMLPKIFPLIQKTPATAVTDSKSIYDTMGTSHRASDKSLIVHIGYIRQLIDDNELTLIWKEGSTQLSNVLTKRGASTSLLTQTLSIGKFQLNC